MTLHHKNLKNLGQLKKNVRNIHKCPLCNENVEVGVEHDMLMQLQEEGKFPYAHIHLHGNPLHAMLCYIDKDLAIRSTGVIKSIEISRDSTTFNHLIRKWSNPY